MSTLPRLLLLTDRSQLRLGRGLVATVRECVGAGLTHVVVREHDLAPGARSALVRTLADVPGLTVISSRVPERHAHGLHLPASATQHRPRPARADAQDSCNAGLRSQIGPEMAPYRSITPRYMGAGAASGSGAASEWWGRSCHTTEEVRRAAAEGAAYVTLSPFATSVSKPGYGPPLPRASFALEAATPVFALGGISVDNAAVARDAGAHGVAVMGEVMRAADPAGAVARLLEAVR